MLGFSTRVGIAVLGLFTLAACDQKGSTESAAARPAASTSAQPAPAPAPASASVSVSVSASSDNIFDTAAKGSGFTVGNMMAARQIYVFFDPQCPHCGHLWNAAKPLMNQVRMVWLPVGFIAPRSTTQGAALLAATDPVAAMSAHEQSLLAQQGGMTPPDNLPAELTDKVKANTKLWQQIGGESVPTIVFKSPANGQPGKFAGALDTEGLKKLIGI